MRLPSARICWSLSWGPMQPGPGPAATPPGCRGCPAGSRASPAAGRERVSKGGTSLTGLHASGVGDGRTFSTVVGSPIPNAGLPSPCRVRGCPGARNIADLALVVTRSAIRLPPHRGVLPARVPTDVIVWASGWSLIGLSIVAVVYRRLSRAPCWLPFAPSTHFTRRVPLWPCALCAASGPPGLPLLRPRLIPWGGGGLGRSQAGSAVPAPYPAAVPLFVALPCVWVVRAMRV